MAWRWFVQVGDRIDGPFSTQEVQNRLHSGHLIPEHLIWSEGEPSWRTLRQWTSQQSSQGNVIEALAPDQSPKTPQVWHYANEGKSNGPLTEAAMIAELKKVEHVQSVLLWTRGMQEWAPIFEFHDILHAVGVNKRQFPRADINGQLVIKGPELNLIAPLQSISEGGVGTTLPDGTLIPGQTVTLEMKSTSFRDTLVANAEVRYTNANAVGLRFTHISAEHQAAIVQLIQQHQVKFSFKAA